MFTVLLLSDKNIFSNNANSNVSIHQYISISNSFPDLKRLPIDLLILDENICNNGIMTALEKIRSIKKVPIWLISNHNDSITRLSTSKLGVVNILPSFNQEKHLYEYIQNYFYNLKFTKSSSEDLSNVISIDKLIFNEDEMSVQYDGGIWQPMQPKQGALLKYLMLHVDTTVSPESIIKCCFGYEPTELDSSDLKLLRTQISVLRTILRRASNEKTDASQYIKTEVNRGYKFLSKIN